MPEVAILIPASPTPAFFSQIAAISRAVQSLSWQRWNPRLYAYFGGHANAATEGVFSQWLPLLEDVEIIRVAERRFSREFNWAQCDATMRLAPRDADVLVSLDADTLPVDSFEDVLDRVVDANAIAGVMAHYPFPGEGSPMENWRRLAQELIRTTLTFEHSYSLVRDGETEDRRRAPFYINGGVIFYPRSVFDVYAKSYLELRRALASRMSYNDFSGQVAITLAVAQEGIDSLALPMRYNFPNDPIAQELHAGEAERVVIFHYLRTTEFDRHLIFTTPERYAEFLRLPLQGINKRFQNAVRNTLGSDYPFAEIENVAR